MKTQFKNPALGGYPYKKSIENEDSEDGYISPQDISIKDEKIWDPTDEEILSYALKLGYDIEKDPDELFEVAYYYMKYPLPEGWKRGIMKSTKELVYINLLDGEIEVTTEIEEMAHQMYLEKKSEMNQKNVSLFNKSPEKKETTTVVPRKKIPPLNPLQKSTNSNGMKNDLPSIKGSNIKSTKNNDKKNEDIFGSKQSNLNNDINPNENIIKLNNNIDKFLEKSLKEKDFKDLDKSGGFKDKEINKNNNEKEPKLNLKDKKKSTNELMLHLGEDDEEDEEDEIEEEEDDIIGKDNKLGEEKEDSFLQKMLNREKEIEQLRKQKEKDIENVLNKNENLKNLIDIKKIKSQNELNEEEERGTDKQPQMGKNLELFKEKKEYLKKKLAELQEYRDEMKMKYQDKKEEYDKNKKEKQNKYNNKLKEEITKSKNKLEKQYNEKIELFEKQLINKKAKEEKRYREELKNNIKSKREEDKENIKKKEEKEKEELKQKKLDLLKEIENLKKQKVINESNLSQKRLNLQKKLLFFEEKKNMEKKNRVKKNELEIKNLENQLENEFQQNKKKLSKNISETTIIKPNIPQMQNTNMSMGDNLFNDMQKVLEDEYDINCKTFEQELQSKKLKELDKYTNMITNDKNEQLNFYKTEIVDVEKDYYKSIANIRNNCQKNKFNNENNLKLKFEQTLNGYEQTKQYILEQNKQLMKYINDNLHTLMIGNFTLKQTETYLEEFLLNLKDKYLILYQKNKNDFEMYESDYIFKTQFIKYLLDIINYMTKLFSNTKLKDKNDNNEIGIGPTESQNIAENLLNYCNDKINEYRKKYKKTKNSNIFHFMNGDLMKSQSFDNSRLSDLDDINKTILFDPISRRKNILKNNEYNANNQFKLNSKNNENNIDSNNYINSNNSNINSNININNIIGNNDSPTELTYYVIEQENNFIVPVIPQNVLSKLNEDILILYSNITLFLKKEYNNILEISQMLKENNKLNVNIKCNISILETIRTFTEETFNYLLLNYQKVDKILNIKKKLRLISSHIQEYKSNFCLDKYLLKNKPINILNENNDEVDSLQLGSVVYKNNLNINNFINKKQDISNNLNSKNYTKSTKEIISEKEEQKQSGYSDNSNKNISKNNDNNKNYLEGRFNNFYRQYSQNSLVNGLNNPFSYQFFSYKRNKYELDKNLSKFS